MTQTLLKSSLVITSKYKINQANAAVQSQKQHSIAQNQMEASISPILLMVRLILAIHQINKLLSDLRSHQPCLRL
jgi:hypothetical protein